MVEHILNQDCDCDGLDLDGYDVDDNFLDDNDDDFCGIGKAKWRNISSSKIIVIVFILMITMIIVLILMIICVEEARLSGGTCPHPRL